MSMLKFGHAAVVTPVVDQGKWVDKKVEKSRLITAKSVIAKYDPSQWLLSHVTIMASVDVELADPNDKKSDYYIKPEYSVFVNNNGDSWERELLRGCYRSFLGADNYCFPAGTRVLMSDGTYKDIDKIVEGDRVINRKGEVAPVTKTFKRQASDLVEINSRGILSRSLFTTRNHPFWVYHARETCPKTGRPNHFDIDTSYCLLKDWVGFSTGVHRHKGEIFPSGLTPSWKEAGTLDTNRDLLTHPISSVEIDSDEINENRAELIGWFLAEGSYMKTNDSSDEESGVSFALGNDETDIGDRLGKLLTIEFGDIFLRGGKTHLYETESGSYNLWVSNKKVAEYFKKWCGKYAWAKKMPEAAMFLPKKLQAIILKHCLEGDGCGTIPYRGYSLEIKSKALIQQMLWISWRLGFQPTYREVGVIPRYTDLEMVDGYEVFVEPATGKRSRPGYLLRFSTRDSKKLNEFLDFSDVRMASRLDKRHTHIFEETNGTWMVSKIDSVVPSNVSCDVYNIEVQGDNSYVAEGVVVHNCEHVQIPELSKGKVIDVALREVPFIKGLKGEDLTTLYVDILIATNRKHTDICDKVLRGEYNATSMGCLIAYSRCTQCGKVAEDEAHACKHVRFFKNNYFYDSNGKKRIIAELCGSKDNPESVKFVDASWVRKPAFEGAVLRNIVSPTEDISEKIGKAVAFPSFKGQEGLYLKAASMAEQIVNEVTAADAATPPPPPPPPPGGAPAGAPAGAPPKDDVGFPGGGSAGPLGAPGADPLGGAPGADPLGGGMGAPGADPLGAPGADPLGGGMGAPPMGAPMGGAPMGGGMGAPMAPQPSQDPAQQAMTNLQRTISQAVVSKIEKALMKEMGLSEEKDRPPQADNATNSSLIKDASFKKLYKDAREVKDDRLRNGLLLMGNLQSWGDLAKYGYSKDDVLGILHWADMKLSSEPVGKDAVGVLRRMKSGSDLKGMYLEMILETGRRPSKCEAIKMAAWSKILGKMS